MAEVPEEVSKLLISHPWRDTTPRLAKYAMRKLANRFWLGIWGGPAPGGIEARDVVQRSIEKVFSGEWAWDPERQESLFDHLISVIDSEISCLVRKWENRHFKREPASGDSGSDGKGTGIWENVPSRDSSPEEVLLHRERLRLSEKFFWDFYECLDEAPPFLQSILECLADGVEKRSEIAERIGIKVREFDNLKKQLQRRLRTFQEKNRGREEL